MNPVALREWLAAQTTPVTYAHAMRGAGATNMRTLTQALELLMDQDATLGHPFLAALVVSRTHPLPNRGFFDHARSLGRIIRDEAAFHAAELAALLAFTSIDPPPAPFQPHQSSRDT